jgi:hypothetical protein
MHLGILKEALQDFSKSTGLYINYHRSCMLPIYISEEVVQDLAQSFGCKVASMPFTWPAFRHH